MKYYNRPFRVVEGGEVYHVAFVVDDEVISFECNPLATDEDSMVIWGSKEEYLEEMGIED